MSDDGTNAFSVQGEFQFFVRDEELPAGATHQTAMDHVRHQIERLGGRVVRREDSVVLGLRARVAQLHETAGPLLAETVRAFVKDPVFRTLYDPHGGTTAELVEEVLLNWAEDLESGATPVGGVQ